MNEKEEYEVSYIYFLVFDVALAGEKDKIGDTLYNSLIVSNNQKITSVANTSQLNECKVNQNSLIRYMKDRRTSSSSYHLLSGPSASTLSFR
jgi:hypothetical protein